MVKAEKELYGASLDIYSFGMTLYDMIFSRNPWARLGGRISFNNRKTPNV